MDGDAENDSAVANKKPKYEGGGMDAASFYGSGEGGKEKEERRHDASGDDSVENGREREKGKGKESTHTDTK